jgi:hypothetical protein
VNKNDNKKSMTKQIVTTVALVASLALTGCTSDRSASATDNSLAGGCKNKSCDNQRNCKCVRFCNCGIGGTAQCK